ncbi:hypothetical protein [Actinoplanes sp. NPDC049599]|uniref:hypothetical protein n=1 Tax=Actinoplanes sp. NPDC049599 TaxID=3363903 RepID=UPI0037A549FA
MTTESMPAGSDPRRLLADVRGLAHRVRVDQRMTWAALLVLARLERNIALLLFTLGYLAVALTLPTNDGWDSSWGIRAGFAIPQVVCAAVLLLGATGFAVARRRRG